VSVGQARAEIINACGEPIRIGAQPEIADGWTTLCSAPCELRGRHLLFYDCRTKLWRVEIFTKESYQGCVV
jgi:hypothetical protein